MMKWFRSKGFLEGSIVGCWIGPFFSDAPYVPWGIVAATTCSVICMAIYLLAQPPREISK